MQQDARPRALELFCGIGGFAAATAGRFDVVRAIDIKRSALDIYELNFPHPVESREIASIPPGEFTAMGADLWWLSPPCQPFTRRGMGRDLDDPRCDALKHLITAIDAVRPNFLAVENVAGFAGSRAESLLCSTLKRCGYSFASTIFCPTQLGLPMRRERYYLVASRDGGIAKWPETTARPTCLAERIDPQADHDSELYPPETLTTQYAEAIDIVDRNDAQAECACFTSAYGRSPVRSGSYLLACDRLRRFSPREILRLMGYPEDYRLPNLPAKSLWPLVGNSLVPPAVRHVLSVLDVKSKPNR